MKKLLIALLLTIVFPAVQGQNRNLKALFAYKTFYSPENGPYVETYLSVNGATVRYVKNAEGKYQGSIEINMRFTDGSGTVRHTDRYNLLSPVLNDTLNNSFNFLDQQRIQLPNGSYKLDLMIADHNSGQKPYSTVQVIPVEFYNNILAISDIELVDSYSKAETSSVLTKSGLDVVPYVDNYYPQHLNSLKFYVEIYNADKVIGGSPYLVSYYIESAESKHVVESLRGFNRANPERVSVLMRDISISELPSGNYNLVVEARNQQNEVLATRSLFFQRSHTPPVVIGADFMKRDISNTFASYITNKDTLMEYINSLHPISSALEITFLNNQLELADVPMMQRFFYDFWSKRNPNNPEKAWIDYHIEVMKVNQEYSTRIMPGYATERGRVYLQYGPPNTMSQHYSEPSAYPYEIWHYYKLGTQTNRKFVFYNPDLVSNDFLLLHSDAQGELSNARWEMDLHKRDTQSNDYDKETKGDEFYGNQANDVFANPR